jgi:hypothetical protein
MLTIGLRLASGNRITRLGDDWILFAGHSQQAFNLNPAALYLSDCLERGTSRAQLVAGLVDAGQDEASAIRATEAFLLKLSNLGALRCSIENDGESPAPVSLRVRIGDITFALRFHDEALLREFGSLFDQPATPEPSTDIVAIDIAREDGLVCIAPEHGPGRVVTANFAVTELRNLMLRKVLADCGEVALHAACLGRNGQALLLCGAPGAGKSTLTLALLRAGFDYLGDDVTLINQQGEVRALPFPLTLKAGSWPIAQDLGAAPDDLCAWDRPDGLTVKYLPVPSTDSQAWRPVRAIASLARGSVGEPSIEPRAKPDQLRALLAEGYAASGKATPEAFAGLVDLVNNAACGEVHYSDAAQAAQLLREWYDR